MIYGTIIPYIITFVFGRIIIIFSYVDIILVKNAQNLKGVYLKNHLRVYGHVYWLLLWQ